MTRRTGPRLATALIAAAFTALAGLAALAALATFDRTEGWRARLAGEMTVAIRPAPGADADAARATEVLAGTRGVAEARALDRARVAALLSPWTAGARGSDLAGLPRLIAVDLDPRKPARREELAAALKAAGVDAVVDDHMGWRQSALDLRRNAAAPLAGALLLCAAGLAAAGAFAAGAQSDRRRAELQIRLRLGATPFACLLPVARPVLADLGLGVLAGGLIAGGLSSLPGLRDPAALPAQLSLLALVAATGLAVSATCAVVTAARRVRELES